MSSRVVVAAILTMVCASSARAGDLPFGRPVIVTAPTVWTASPANTPSPPVVTWKAPAPTVIGDGGRVYTPLPHPGYAPTTVYRPLVPMMPVPQQYYFGRGIIGQPKIYVPGQPIRNFVRYLSL